MLYNLMGNYNTAVGPSALQKNNMGSYNTAGGYHALDGNTTGSYNTSQGVYALFNVVSGNYNSALGYNAGPSTTNHLDNTTALGYLAVPTASNQVRIGNTSVTSIGGEVEWTAFSDGRFKKDIKEDVSGLDFINELRPVSYTIDKAGLNKFLHVTDSSSNQAQTRTIPTRQTGFIAQEVEAIVKKTGYVFSGVDAPENENDPYGLRYAEFVVPLVKGMQELTAILKEQEQKIIAQDQKIDSLVNQLGSKREIEKAVGVNDQAVLFQNNPNPFNAETEIKMTVPEGVGFAAVMIYNLEGKQMKNIQVSDRGEVSVKISGSELSAGTYLYALIADGKVVDTKRMILTQ
jgi:trimeric autotransporter adhesin